MTKETLFMAKTPSRSETRPDTRYAVVVLGMHRSGTSALAGVLARLGCDLPTQMMPANEFNPKGFYESILAYNLNDAILASGGSGWDDWQAFNPDWIRAPQAPGFLERGVEVLAEEYGNSPLFVLKDPRICRLMPFWAQLFETCAVQPLYVNTHRSPVEVARSLQKREGWPLNAGLLLWLRHVLEAEAGSRESPRCFTSYDRLLDNWGAVIETIQRETGIAFPRTPGNSEVEVEAFLSNSLRHSSEAVDSISDNPVIVKWVGATYEILERWATQGETAGDQAKDHAALDAIRADFDSLTPLFGPQVQALRQQQAETAQALTEIGNQRSEEQRQAEAAYTALLAEQQQLQQRFEENDQARETLQTTLAVRDQEAETLRAECAQLKTSARLMKARLQADFKNDLANVLVTQRRNADARVTQQQQEIRGLEAALEQARALERHRAEEAQRLTEDRDRSTAEREDLARQLEAYRSSTSWKITAPLRLVVRGLRWRR
jgi:hypothetical protein